MKTRRFIQCDVFTSIPTKGNGLAVVVDGEGLSDTQMQEFAAWTNLAETTFLFPPTDPVADYKVRIFTPDYEMVFAGHPTLGSCASWLHTGGVPREEGLVRQECGIGIVDIDLTGNVPAFVAPPTSIEPMPEGNLEAITEALKLKPEAIIRSAQLNNGPIWQVVELASARDVLAIEAADTQSLEFVGIGLIGPHEEGAECQYEVRMVASRISMNEDPITGSLNSALAHWMHEGGKYQQNTLVAQGTRLNRQGRVHIIPSSNEPGRMLIGGETQVLIEGTVKL